MTEKELFVSAFMQAEQILNAPYLENSDFGFDFSDKFESKMQSLISKERRIKFSTRRKISKSLLAAVIAAVIMLTGTLSVSASRRKLIDFVETVFSDYISVEPSKDSEIKIYNIETPYNLGYVPDGFTLWNYEQDEIGVTATWTNGKGDEIVFMQDILNGVFIMDNEHEYQEIKLNGYKAYVYGDDLNGYISWTDGSYWFRIHTSGKYKSYLVPMAKNICKKM